MTSTKQELITSFNEAVQPTYTRTPLVLTRGKGSWVFDISGGKYLDFFPGWGASGLGHCHPKVQQALREQIGKMIHVPNNYYSIPQGKLARRMIETSFPGKVFFCNSGAEANEGAIKLARKWGGPDRYEVITIKGSFHGRTLAMIAATGQDKVGSGFEPLPQGFVKVPLNDMAAMSKAAGPKTVAVLIELIQGEGGIQIATPEYVNSLREFCDQKNLLLIVDEVQSGMGRTGKLYSYEHFDTLPDVMTLAKSLGGGFPIGAMVASSRICDCLGPGTHGSTFGGNPLACQAALAVYDTIEREALLEQVVKKGQFLRGELEMLQKTYSVIKEIRGKGLMLGLELDQPGKGIVDQCFERGLLINCTQEKVLRIMPSMTVTKREIDRAIYILKLAFKECFK